MKKLLFSFFLSLITGLCFAQNKAVVDSLEQVLKTAKEDTNKVIALTDLSWEYRKKQPDKAMQYVNIALSLTEKLKWQKGKATCLSRTGIILLWQSKLDEALEYFQKSLLISKKINNKTGIAATYANISYSYELKGDYAKALEYNEKALKIYEELNDKVSIAGCIISSGTLNMYLLNYPAALQHYIKSLGIFEELKNSSGMAIAYNNLAIIYKYQKNYEKALEYLIKGLKIKEEAKITYSISDSYLNVGAIYFYLKDFDKALEYFFKALALDEKDNDKRSVAHINGNIAAVYRNQEKYDLALEYNLKAIKLKEELNDKAGLISSYNNTGIYYTSQKQYEEALKYHEKGLAVARELNDKDGIQNAYEGFFAVYEAQGNFSKALEYHKLSAQMKDSIFSLESSKQLNEMQTKYDSEKKEKEIKMLTQEKEIQGLRLRTQQSELIEQRLEAETKENEIALLNKNREIQQMALEQRESELSRQKMETEAKTREVALLNKDKMIRETELSRQKMLRNSIGAGLALVLVLAFVSYRGYRTKQRANKELELKNKKIETAYAIIEQNRDEIAQKNKDITDSINYAQKIQQAMLPPLQVIKKSLPDSFVLYKPKDIVSGDFYWFSPYPTSQAIGTAEAFGNSPEGVNLKNIPETASRLPGEELIIAACDCTGHGVPGAFMSMIGNDQLNHIIIEKGITNPAEALTHLNRNIKGALKQSADGTQSRDGMDIALVSIKYKKDSEKKADVVSGGAVNLKDSSQASGITATLQFAGAYRPVWVVRKAGEELLVENAAVTSASKSLRAHNQSKAAEALAALVTEVPGNKTSIGGLTEDDYLFTNHEVELQKGDSFYIFTDGYADQFGGDKGKKFKTSQLKELLLSINHLPMEEQKNILEKTIESWKGPLEQIDDICIIGVRI